MGERGTVNHWSGKSQEASAEGKKESWRMVCGHRKRLGFLLCISPPGSHCHYRIKYYVHRRESQVVSTREGVISPGAEFYHHHHTGGLCTFSLLPCTWPMRHLYLLIPVGSEEGRNGWKTDDQKAGDKSQEHHKTADPSPVSPKGRGFEVRNRSRLFGEPPTLQGPPIQSLTTGH